MLILNERGINDSFCFCFIFYYESIIFNAKFTELEGESLKPLILEVWDGKKIKVSPEMYKQCAILNDCMDASEGIDEIISFQIGSFCTKENFKILFSCLENPRLISKINDNKIADILELAGNLKTSLKFRKKLAKKALFYNKEIVFDADLNIISVNNVFEHGYTSRSELNALDLSDKNISFLLGLNNFATDHITEINLSNNKIRYFNSEDCFCLFPNLKKLEIQGNKLKTLKLINTPHNFVLNAQNNRLTDVEIMHLGDGNDLDLRGNRFTESTKDIIKKQVNTRTMSQHSKAFLGSFKNKFIFLTLIMAGIFSYAKFVNKKENLINPQLYDTYNASTFCLSYLALLSFFVLLDLPTYIRCNKPVHEPTRFNEININNKHEMCIACPKSRVQI